MKILITNNKLDTFGGSENWCLTMVQALNKLGHEVHIFTNLFGRIANLIPARPVTIPDPEYDLILCNHSTTIEKIKHIKGYKIQTVHSKFIDIERPSSFVDLHIAISHEIAEYFNIENVIHNPVNTDIFKSTRQVKEIKNLLCLCQTKPAQEYAKQFALENNLNIRIHTKWKDPLTQTQLSTVMNWSDLIMSVGRGVYEGLACERNIICYDDRGYDSQNNNYYFLNVHNFYKALEFNFTGRAEIQDQYFENKPVKTYSDNFNYINIANEYIQQNRRFL